MKLVSSEYETGDGTLRVVASRQGGLVKITISVLHGGFGTAEFSLSASDLHGLVDYLDGLERGVEEGP